MRTHASQCLDSARFTLPKDTRRGPNCISIKDGEGPASLADSVLPTPVHQGDWTTLRCSQHLWDSHPSHSRGEEL